MQKKTSGYRKIPPRRMVEIIEVRKETEAHTTLSFRDEGKAEPGQFLMVWIPGMDEIPMGYSRTGDIKEFTVHNVGEATGKLCAARPGDRLGIRGPLGRGFEQVGKSLLVVGGGCGTSPLAPLVENASELGWGVDVCIGASTEAEVLMAERLRSLKGVKVHISTDDGTMGTKGYVSSLAEELMNKNGGGYDCVYTCGPEIMMKKVAESSTAHGIPCQVSLERYMKCGIGICDSCAISGKQVCTTGPVFNQSELAKMPEFGNWKRGPDGKRVPI